MYSIGKCVFPECKCRYLFISTPFDTKPLISAEYEGWNFNSGNYLFTADTK